MPDPNPSDPQSASPGSPPSDPQAGVEPVEPDTRAAAPPDADNGPATSGAVSARPAPPKRYRSRLSVRAGDVTARILITAGGVGTIAAVLMVFLFLAWVAADLFMPASLSPRAQLSVNLPAQPDAATPPVAEPAGADPSPAPSPTITNKGVAHLATNEYNTMALLIHRDGLAQVVDIAHRPEQGGGSTLHQQHLVPPSASTGSTVTAVTVTTRGDHIALGTAAGQVYLGTIGFETRFLPYDPNDPDQPPPTGLAHLTPGESAPYRDGIAEMTPRGQYRLQRFTAQLDEPVDVADTAITHLAYTPGRGTSTLAALTEDGVCHLIKLRKRRNLMTGRTEITKTQHDFPLNSTSAPDPAEPPVTDLLVNGRGDELLVVRTAAIDRYDIARIDSPRPIESIPVRLDGYDGDPVPMVWTPITNADYILGDTTLLAARGYDGHVGVYFPTQGPDDEPGESRLTLARVLDGAGGQAIANSNRSRLVALARGDTIGIYQATNGTRIAQAHLGPDGLRHQGPTDNAPGINREDAVHIEALAISPTEDRLLVLATRGPRTPAAESRLYLFNFDKKHPDVTLTSIISPIWYEGQPRPTHTWQTIGADDAFEPKLGLMPLVFGTLKATFYSVIFAIPLALLAAVFTSEFLHPAAKARIKPVVEMMASLPSVVLGFLAGLVFAPMIDTRIPAVLTAFLTVPLMFVLTAQLWQLLPIRAQAYLDQLGLPGSRGEGTGEQAGRGARSRPIGGPLGAITIAVGGIRMIVGAGVLVSGIAAAAVIGPRVEALLFGGNLIDWLSHANAVTDADAPTLADLLLPPAISGHEARTVTTGGWFLLALPLAAVLVGLLVTRYLDPPLLRASHTWTRSRVAGVNLVKFLAGTLAALVLGWLTAVALAATGMDPRGPMLVGSDVTGYFDIAPFGQFDQRNALIVGFAMGFAVVPIIYTIAEDALSAVPDHLRSASLGCGATPWQTAIRVVIPTAMSGLFSACMIGLGRAVGETMIVLMATGNTPLMDLNVFSGFRTLSATIAVEMPEAVKDSTHYRMLFFCALALFVMTFFVNTIAEAVRIRFRNKAKGL